MSENEANSKSSLTHSGPSSDNGGGAPGSAWGSVKRHPLLSFLVVAVILALTAVLVIKLKNRGASEEEKANVVVSVKVAQAVVEPITATASAVGTIVPREQATVSAKIASQIKTMGIIRNKQVKAGEVVVTLETRDLQAQRDEAAGALQEARLNLRGLSIGSIPQTNAQDEKALRDARANLTNATATYERRKVLFQQGGISKKDLEASELAVKTAENDLNLAENTMVLHKSAINPNDRQVAESKVKQGEEHLAMLNAQLSYADIRAPLSGVITDQFKFQGEFISPGDKLFSVADTSEMIVKAPFPDNVASQLKTGDAATVKPADTGKEIEGKVSLVSRAGDPSSRTFEVWVNLPNKDGSLRPGGSAEVTVNTNQATDSVTVPIPAVTLDATNANTGSVMVVDDKSIAKEVKVTVGIRSKDNFQITSGLKGGEQVVVEGNYALPDNTKVAIDKGDAGKDNKGGSGKAEPGSDSGDKN
ncbi:MAG TPA: efflux RND transporter periplasmic adaptor subunit [Blastocatellia bacterium]|nr:efflux RND transporter periplasmic adaptor subunit [Blastocatellia bacterium]